MVTLGVGGLYYVGSISAGNDKIIDAIKIISTDHRKLLIAGGTPEFSKAFRVTFPEAHQVLHEDILGLEVPTSSNILSNLAQLERKYPGLQAFSQFAVSENNFVLVEAFDVGNGTIMISPILTNREIHQFSDHLEVTLEVEKYYDS